MVTIHNETVLQCDPVWYLSRQNQLKEQEDIFGGVLFEIQHAA